MGKCKYVLVDTESNGWECSKCGTLWNLMEGTPAENEMCYCPGCGRTLDWVKITEKKQETVGDTMNYIEMQYKYYIETTKNPTIEGFKNHLKGMCCVELR